MLGSCHTAPLAGTLVSTLSTVVAKLLFPDQISSAVVEWFISSLRKSLLSESRDSSVAICLAGLLGREMGATTATGTGSSPLAYSLAP